MLSLRTTTTAVRRGLTLIGAVALSTACASSGAIPRPFPTPGPTARGPVADTPMPPPLEPGADVSAPAPDVPGPLAPPPAVAAVIETALALIGAPYRNGGSTPDGFDCSGFTQWVFARHGLVLPRDTKAQFAAGAPVEEAVSAGDLLFFSTVAPGASHVAIALDDDRFIHAPSSRGVIRIERRSSSYWSRRYVGARRLEATADQHDSATPTP